MGISKKKKVEILDLIHFYHSDNTCYYVSSMIIMPYKAAAVFMMCQQVLWKHSVLP